MDAVNIHCNIRKSPSDTVCIRAGQNELYTEHLVDFVGSFVSEGASSATQKEVDGDKNEKHLLLIKLLLYL